MTAMGPIHVVHILDNLSPGGTERQCLQLVRGLSRLGMRNTVIYFSPGPMLDEFESAGVPAHAAPQARVQSIRFPLSVIALAGQIRRHAPDVVQTYCFYTNFRGLIAARAAGVRVRVAGRREFGRTLSAAHRRADRWALRLAHRIVANSEAIRQQLLVKERVPSDKVVVIRNGLDLQPPPADQQAAAGHGDPLVGMVAHFRQDKDHLTFLNAASTILRSAPSVRFCFVGTGRLEPAARDWAQRLGIADRVEFLGHLDRQALWTVLPQISVSVLASKTEGLPNSVIESMAAGRPVVATAVGGTRELVDDGVTGFLVPPGDPDALAGRILRLLNDPPLARSMGERARQKIEREFTAERMGKQFCDLYRGLLEERAPA